MTTNDREEAYEKIVEAAPYQPGYEDAVPIPLTKQTSKELTDDEIYDVFEGCLFKGGFNKYEFARAILRKAQEKC